MKDMVQVRRQGGQRYTGPDVRLGRSQFNRSHGIKTAFDASRLVPILVDEVLPGDTFTCRLNGYCRVFSPLDAPIMDNIELDTTFFFVPTRLLWDNWEAFNGAHDDAGAQDATFTIPVLASGITVDHDHGTDVQDLLAYMGVPATLSTSSEYINALPLRAYNLIYNEWFRDQDLIDQVTVNTGDGPDTAITYGVWKTAKKHDYFTSARPELQKGSASVAAVIPRTTPGSEWPTFRSPTGGAGATGIDLAADTTASPTWARITATSGTPAAGERLWWENPNLDIDINQLRLSVAVQRLLETDQRGGTRYTEIIKSHFGVTNPDFRLQRPEYLGGGKALINVSAVANTSATATEDQGELRGVGTGVIQGHAWAKSFTEHGYVIGLIRARGDITYCQGLDRFWSRRTRYDFYIPALANLGEQSILNKELYVDGSATDDEPFAYAPRWEEYRTKKSLVVNVFNPASSPNLDHWHIAEFFGSRPALNQTFVEDQTPMSRVTTTTTYPDFILDLWFDYKCARPLPVYSIPSIEAPRF